MLKLTKPAYSVSNQKAHFLKPEVLCLTQRKNSASKIHVSLIQEDRLKI